MGQLMNGISIYFRPVKDVNDVDTLGMTSGQPQIRYHTSIYMYGWGGGGEKLLSIICISNCINCSSM